MEVGSVPSKGQPPEEPQVLWEVVLSTLDSNPSRWSPLSLSEGVCRMLEIENNYPSALT